MKALLVIDLQNGVCKEDKVIYNYDHLIKGVNQRIQKNRELQQPLIFIQHNDSELVYGSESWQLVSELDFLTGDFLIQKTHANSFFKTKLQQTLSDLKVTEIELCGAQTEYCVDTTIKVAHSLGYQLTMYRGLNSTFDNGWMTAEQTIRFYENIWDQRFLVLKNLKEK